MKPDSPADGFCPTPHTGGQESLTADPTMAGGRLTLTSGTAVTTADVTAATQLYYTPYKSNRISLKSNNRWIEYSFKELQLAASLLAASTVYDLFVTSESGQHSAFGSSGERLSLQVGPAWTNDSTRAEAPDTADGVKVRKGRPNWKWIGIVRTDSGPKFNDSGGISATAGIRAVWNAYNRIPRFLYACPGYVDDNTLTSFTHTNTSWAALNGGTGASVAYISGGEDAAQFIANGSGDPAAGAAQSFGIGDNVTTTSYAEMGDVLVTQGTRGTPIVLQMIPALGYRTVSILNRVSAGTGTVYADNIRNGGTTDPRMTYLQGIIMA